MPNNSFRLIKILSISDTGTKCASGLSLQVFQAFSLLLPMILVARDAEIDQSMLDAKAQELMRDDQLWTWELLQVKPVSDERLRA